MRRVRMHDACAWRCNAREAFMAARPPALGAALQLRNPQRVTRLFSCQIIAAWRWAVRREAWNCSVVLAQSWRMRALERRACRTVAMAASWVKKSGAPLPKERSVAPATLAGSFKKSEITSRAGQKKCSVTTISSINNTKIHRNRIK
jgi:hypothetical protein